MRVYYIFKFEHDSLQVYPTIASDCTADLVFPELC